MDDLVAKRWDGEFAAGRYRTEPPLPFVEDILRAAAERGLEGANGLYIGCGNGRNYIPLVAGGLDLIGLDISRRAIEQLAERAPERCHRLVLGDLTALPSGSAYSVVIGIQVFQHGDRRAMHRFIAQALSLVSPGGLFCLRVNATGTDVWPEHDLHERHADGGFTVRYLAGPKRGLLIHFFSLKEIESLFRRRLDVVLPLRLTSTRREPPALGQWSQWEAIWCKRKRA